MHEPTWKTIDSEDEEVGEASSKTSVDEAIETWTSSAKSKNGAVGLPLTVNTPSALILNTKMYIAGEYFDIPALKSLAVAKYQQSLSNNWKTIEFSKAAKLLWENTMDEDRALLNIVATTANQHIDILMDRSEFQTMTHETKGFGLDILKLQLGRSLEMPKTTISH